MVGPLYYICSMAILLCAHWTISHFHLFINLFYLLYTCKSIFIFLPQEQEILQRKNRRSRGKKDLFHMVFGKTVELAGCVILIV